MLSIRKKCFSGICPSLRCPPDGQGYQEEDLPEGNPRRLGGHQRDHVLQCLQEEINCMPSFL